MEDSNFTRVKLTFRKKIKVAKLDSRVDTSLSSLRSLKKLIYKNFPEIEEIVDASTSLSSSRSITRRQATSAPKNLLVLQFENAVGGFTTLESEADLKVAMEVPTGILNFKVDLVTVSDTVTSFGETSVVSSGSSETLEGSSPSWTREGNLPGRQETFEHDARRRQPRQGDCNSFKSGHCRNGPTCRYFHDVQTSADNSASKQNPFKNSREFEYWLTNQHSLSAAENIDQLSGDKGLHVLREIAEKENLFNHTITQFVKVLVKEGIRLSLLREKTNKIYGTLLGSPFLMHLHVHIAAQFENSARSRAPADLKPYLLLIKEIQYRTAAGWKEVSLSLDTLHGVVSQLDESYGVADLMEMVRRLINQREKLRQKSATAPATKYLIDNEAECERIAMIVPGRDELTRFQTKDLPVIRIGATFSRVSEYISTHFQLLREDFIDPLRRGLRTYCTNYNAEDNSDIHIYTGVRLLALRCGDREVDYVVSFQLTESIDAETVHSSKRLMSRLIFGALLCISSDGFKTFFWGVVSVRKDLKEEFVRGRVTLRIIAESEPNVARHMRIGETSSLETYVMVESAAANFGSYFPVLKCLLREEMEDLPFTQHLLQLEPKVKAPSYLSRRENGDRYDFSSDIHAMMAQSSLHILEEWPGDWTSPLDRAQQDALKHALTKELALVQGPPGTGKTFLGLLIVKILLANLNCSDSDGSIANRRQATVEREELSNNHVNRPILVICGSNHALDRFLEGIYPAEPNIVRIGGGQVKKNAKLSGRDLYYLKMQKGEIGLEASHRRFLGQARFERARVKSNVEQCINQVGVKFVTRELLDGLATSNQIESLFSVYRRTDNTQASDDEIVQMWLNEGSGPDPLSGHDFLTDPDPDTYQSVDSRISTETSLRGLLQNPNGKDSKTRPWRRRIPGHCEAHDHSGRFIEAPPLVMKKSASIGSVDGEIPEPVDTSNVWRLSIGQRRMLHLHWVEEIRRRGRIGLIELSAKYQQACKVLYEGESEIALSVLRKAKVIGMTATAGARHFDMLRSLQSEVVMVQEAADVLEGHLLACLTSSVKHLIMIGDHLQLRPYAAVDRLATEHNLEVSMFERLIRSGVEHVTLREQRRMRPAISKLVKSLYPELKDHESVLTYDAVPGVTSNVFFFDHRAEEDQIIDDSAIKVNATEAELVVELCVYLLNQGCHSVDSITIITIYNRQMHQISDLLRQRISSRKWVRPIDKHAANADTEDRLPRVCSVDDFQGEESDIVILSLVSLSSNMRTDKNGQGRARLLRSPNRTCVALTRARKGLYIFGNAELLAEKLTLWKSVTDSLREDGALGPYLELYCQNHPNTKTKISKVEHFKKVEDGGCSEPCEYELECGHACPRRCHPGSHDLVVCPKCQPERV